MNEFIIEERILTEFGEEPHAYFCRFSIDRFRDDLFRQSGIHYPQNLTRAVAKRRAEFFAGRYCARSSLLAAGFASADIGIGDNRQPLWPNNVVGAISHSGSAAVAISARQSRFAGLGVDVEREVECATYEKIKSQVLFGGEQSLVHQAGSRAHIYFSLVFSAKESFFKAAWPQVRRFFGFSALALLDIDSRENTLLFELAETLSPELQKGRRVLADFRFFAGEQVMTLVKLEH